MSTVLEALDQGGIVTPQPARSHIGVIGPAAAFRRNPRYVLVGVLDVTGFAMNAVLRVDHVARAARLLHPLIDPGRAIAGGWTAIEIMFGRFLQLEVGDLQMYRLVLFMVRVGEKHR